MIDRDEPDGEAVVSIDGLVRKIVGAALATGRFQITHPSGTPTVRRCPKYRAELYRHW